MNLPFKFAKRYIFSKKSTNAINIISSIAVLGIAIGSMALIIIMSVFNGFEGLLGNLIGSFKPDVKITVNEGKVFVADSSMIQNIRLLEGVHSISKTLEEIALFEYDGVQNIAHIKGVDENYIQVTAIDTCLEGNQKYLVYDTIKDINYTVIGANLAYPLNISVGQAFNRPITIYMPKREGRISTNPTKKPFKKRKAYPSAIYEVQQSEYDNYAITNLAFVQEITSYKNGEISALEIKLDPAFNETQTLQAIRDIAGDDYIVQNRYQQDEALYNITQLEKIVAYFIFAFTLVLVAFNMVGALWMLVLDKQKDISILKSMGATSKLIRQIFLMEGFLLSLIGLLLGCFLAIVLCVLQQQYGLVKLSGSGEFIINAYPVEMRLGDFVVVILTVLGIGTSAAWLPAQKASTVENIQRKE
ncbi:MULTISPECIES: FtsX-like permease family protein [unclassified Aureispira]|uniref:ABC transporter permease n=1 Tax=unclassified Aureispira TaxID=2649989 RepID=UPI000697E187|nr:MULTISPECIES: FtsX-like permease family protein [unclassified Aureispira]WMX14068.1 FtsX-like permease family protein [Aureispira sp. CCB-E]